MQRIIQIPRRLHEESVIPLIEEIWQIGPDDDLVIDLSHLHFAQPYGALILASELAHHYEITGKPISISGFDDMKHSHSYLAHIGFFKLALFNIGKVPGEARGSTNYVPFKVIEMAYFEKMNRELQAERGLTKPLGDLIDEESRNLAQVVVNSRDENMIGLIAYCFREIIRNVFEHAKTRKCLLCAQRYDNSGFVEVAIADKGCGVMQSMRKRFDVKTHREALTEAIRPGITSESISKDGGYWENTGYGLYVLSELGRKYGQFSICSGDNILFCRDSSIRYMPYKFSGTAVQLLLPVNSQIVNPAMIRTIVKQGESIAPRFGGVKKASRGSSKI